jgi:hypothetical protein
MSQLSKALVNTRDYFFSRAFSDWVTLLDDAIKLEQSNDYSFVHGLWCKFGDTCDVDNLFITEYESAHEDQINILNAELAERINMLFSALDEIAQNET